LSSFETQSDLDSDFDFARLDLDRFAFDLNFLDFFGFGFGPGSGFWGFDFGFDFGFDSGFDFDFICGALLFSRTRAALDDPKHIFCGAFEFISSSANSLSTCPRTIGLSGSSIRTT
jgi:hypothetical protein